METANSSFDLRKILNLIRDYFFLLLKKWWIIAIVSLIFGFWYYFKAKQKHTLFSAHQSFMVKEDEGGGSLFSNILGQFGLKGGGPKGEYNLDKLIEISKSKKILTQTVFTEATVNDKKDLLINHIVEIYKLEEEWDEEDMKDFKGFTTMKDFDRTEMSVINHVYSILIGSHTQKGAMYITYDDESGIIHLYFSTRNENLSKVLTETLYVHLSKFYIEQAREKQEKTLDKLEEKKDSLHQILIAKEYALAQLNDQGFGVILQKDKVKKTRLSSEIFLLNTMYSELIKNVENAAFSLKNSTPIFQIIDKPSYPLRIIAHSTIINVLKGLIIGGLLAIAFFIGRNLFFEALNKEN